MSGFEITEAGDMKSIKFTVPGNPFGKQRPKFARMGTYTKTYTPKETTQHEKQVEACFLEVARGRRFKEKEPLDIRIIAYYPIPQSTSKKDKTVSRMRFELGDTMVEGNSDTAALTDEEIQVAINSYPKSWKKAKLMLLESLYRRFSYEVDTKTGPLTLNLHDRAVMWKEDYLALKKEIQQESCSVPPFAGGATNKPPYFYTGMQQNERAKG